MQVARQHRHFFGLHARLGVELLHPDHRRPAAVEQAQHLAEHTAQHGLQLGTVTDRE
jgi:hypothetical protein